MSVVRTVPASALVCNKLISQALQSHDVLSPEDIAFGANYICNLRLGDEQLAPLLLMISKDTNTGRFALSFNHELDNALKIRDASILGRILNGQNFLVELYDNEELTGEEQAVIERMLTRELAAITATLKQGEVLLARGQLGAEDLLVPCADLERVQVSVGDRQATLYSRCYDQVCLKESVSQIPTVIYTVDQAPGDAAPNTYCFDVMELIAGLAQDPPLNPTTRQPFSSLALSLLLPRFEKEVKLYRRYLKQLRRAGLSA